MLLKYSVSNFKSIGHNIEFSMLPLENNCDDKFLTEIETVVGKMKILKRGAFFGPNASGKTSFINSLDFAVKYILDGPQGSSFTRVNQFRGELESLDGLTTFQFMILVDKQIYTYGFSLDKNYVHEEWLEILGANGYESMFERHTNENKITSITLSSQYAEKKSKERQLAELLTESIKEKQAAHLFLKKLAENGSEKGDIVYSWFGNIRIIYPSYSFQNLPFIIRENKEFRDFLSNSLSAIDTGINQVSTSENMDLNEFSEKYKISSKIIKDIETSESGAIRIRGKYFHYMDGNVLRIEFEHSLNNKSVKFNLEDESDGTQRIIDLLPLLFKSENNDANLIFIVDELDRSLHTKLTKYIVSHFIQSDNRCQLIFTTHDVNLLNLKLFRQEEIWFIDKNLNGESILKPFSDFDVENEEDVLKDYLAGRFGAVPVIKGEI